MLFSIPNIITMVFMSLYTIVDSICVARFVGTDAMSAVNIVYPVVSVELAVSIMLAAGGSALIARKIGEGRDQEAKSDFTIIVLTSLLIGALIAILSTIFMRPLLVLLGATSDGGLYALCHDYFSILIAFAPAFLLQTIFQYFLIAAGKPTLGIAMMILAGVTNIVLDIFFMGAEYGHPGRGHRHLDRAIKPFARMSGPTGRSYCLEGEPLAGGLRALYGRL